LNCKGRKEKNKNVERQVLPGVVRFNVAQFHRMGVQIKMVDPGKETTNMRSLFHPPNPPPQPILDLRDPTHREEVQSWENGKGTLSGGGSFVWGTKLYEKPLDDTQNAIKKRVSRSENGKLKKGKQKRKSGGEGEGS